MKAQRLQKRLQGYGLCLAPYLPKECRYGYVVGVLLYSKEPHSPLEVLDSQEIPLNNQDPQRYIFSLVTSDSPMVRAKGRAFVDFQTQENIWASHPEWQDPVRQVRLINTRHLRDGKIDEAAVANLRTLTEQAWDRLTDLDLADSAYAMAAKAPCEALGWMRRILERKSHLEPDAVRRFAEVIARLADERVCRQAHQAAEEAYRKAVEGSTRELLAGPEILEDHLVYAGAVAAPETTAKVSDRPGSKATTPGSCPE